MYSLKEFWQLRNLPFPEGEWDGNVICLETNAEWSFGANKTHGFLSCYIYTIVTRGWVTILYNNRELTLHVGDLYTYSPGFEVTVLSSSSDYSGICLLADEHFTLSLPTVRDAIRTAYFTVVELTSPVLSLKAEDLQRLKELMQMMIHYQQTGLPHANESQRMLYNLFLTDLSTIQQHSIREHRFPKRVEELFLGFLGLLPQHFAEHHDIGFYASRLCITTTYLSRVGRKVSGGSCEYFRDNQPVLMPVGMKQRFYYDMPSHIERRVKNTLISHYGRTLYYRYHGGSRPIPPEVQATIENVCRQAGWTQPLQFDGQEEAYLW